MNKFIYIYIYEISLQIFFSNITIYSSIFSNISFICYTMSILIFILLEKADWSINGNSNEYFKKCQSHWDYIENIENTSND